MNLKNKVTAENIKTTISKFPDNIKFQCNYQNTVSISADFNGTMSDATQVLGPKTPLNRITVLQNAQTI